MQDEQSLREMLTRSITTIMAAQADAGTTRFLATEDDEARAKAIANELIYEAVARGLPQLRGELEHHALSGGNATEMVAFFTLKENFAFKLDSKSVKLVDEAKTMRAIRASARLPRRYREAWPLVHAIRDMPPYAYLFEFFSPEERWKSLENRLFSNGKPGWAPEGDPERMITVALDYIFEGFEAGRTPRIQPNLAEDYVERIRGRLIAAARLDSRFASQPLTINGERIEPWERLVDRLEANAAAIAAIVPSFTTVVHGDPHPGNLMLREEGGDFDLKFIDPKDWGIGDYLFDMTKLTHFLTGTGPVEKPVSSGRPTVRYEAVDGGAALTYEFDRPAWTDAVIAICRERIARFARLHADTGWEARYELGMAANLLGLPEGRLKKGRAEPALILYGEGLGWLRRFLSTIEAGAAAEARPIVAATVGPVEPGALGAVRQRLLATIPKAREAIDRRGFRLVHFDPARSNDRGKPGELSLEHEGRLKPAQPGGAEPLRALLRDSEGRRLSEVLPGSEARFGDLEFKRFDRPPGPQSSDLYFDLADRAPSKGWIAAMLSLRQRRMSSSFMSWGQTRDATLLPLNLELPFVGYGETGVIARLEFNWIDDLDLSIADFRQCAATGKEDPANPLFSAAHVVPVDPAGERFVPVLSHTTFREKFALTDPARPDDRREVFHVNIDDVTVKSLRTGRVATFCDVDIAPCDVVDEAVLTDLIALTGDLARQFDLVPIEATKAWRGLAETDGLE